MASKRKLLAWTMAVTASLIFVNPPAAQAAWSQCPADAFCLWQHSEGNGIMVWVPLSLSGQPDLRAWSFDDTTSSVANMSGRNACAYEHPNYQGGYIVIEPHTIFNLEGAANDTVSSARWC